MNIWNARQIAEHIKFNRAQDCSYNDVAEAFAKLDAKANHNLKRAHKIGLTTKLGKTAFFTAKDDRELAGIIWNTNLLK